MRIRRESGPRFTPSDVLRSLERDVFPPIGSVPIGQLTPPRVFENLNGKEPVWHIPALRMKGGHERKAKIGGDHLVPLAPQSVKVLRALWPLTGRGDLVFPSNRHGHKSMSENALGYLLNWAGYHGHHVPYGFRAVFSTIMNEWAERGEELHDRRVIDLMLAHVPREKVERAYNRAAYMDRRRNWR